MELGDDLVAAVEPAKEVFRGPSFFDPERLGAAREALELALRVHSIRFPDVELALGAAEYKFNVYSPGLLLDYVEDDGRNIFRDFFRSHHIRKARGFQPHLYGISVTSIEQLAPALSLAALLRERLPDTRIVLGGDIVTRLQGRLVRNPRVRRYFDYLVCGAGEDAIVGLAEALTGERPTATVPNLLYMSGRTATWTRASETPNQARMPFPDFDGLPLGRYLTPEPILPVQFSRGCYWGRCTFCEIVGTPYSAKSPDRAVAEMLYLGERYGVSRFAIVDSAAPPVLLHKVARELARSGRRFTWRAMIRGERYYSEEVVHDLYCGGCRMVMIGVESGSRRVLDLMNKGTTPRALSTILKRFSDAGIWVHGFFMFGFPGEKMEDAGQTLQFIRRNAENLSSAAASWFILPLGSIVDRQRERFGLTIGRRPRIETGTLLLHQTDLGGAVLDQSERSRVAREYTRYRADLLADARAEDLHVGALLLYLSRGRFSWNTGVER